MENVAWKKITKIIKFFIIIFIKIKFFFFQKIIYNKLKIFSKISPTKLTRTTAFIINRNNMPNWELIVSNMYGK